MWWVPGVPICPEGVLNMAGETDKLVVIELQCVGVRRQSGRTMEAILFR